MTFFLEKKTPPNTIPAENIILGHLLVNPSSIMRIFEKLPLDAFYSDINKILYKTAYSLYSKNLPINFITISDDLIASNLLDFIGGTDFLFQISNQDIVLEDLETYISLVLDKYLRRTVFNISSKISKMAYDQSYSLEFLIDENRKMISSITDNKSKIGLLTTSEVLLETFIQLEKTTKQGGISGICSGFFELDSLTGGFQKGDLIIIAGRPSMGKTTLALNLAKNISEIQTFPVVIFSLEMSRQQIIYRFIASEAQVNSTKLKSGTVNSNEWYFINKSISYLANLKIYLDDSLSNSLSDIKIKLIKLKSKSKHIGAVIIDYLQLLTEKNHKETRSQELSKITRGLKLMSKELDSPIIVLSQLSRNLESRPDKRPLLSDLRESGCLSGANNLYSLNLDKFVTVQSLHVKQNRHSILSKTINSLSLIRNYFKKTINTGYKSFFKIRTVGNYEIELSSEHKVFTIKGWIKVQILSKNDCIAVFDQYNFAKIFIDKCKKLILGDIIFCLVNSIHYKSTSFVYDIWFPYTKNFICNNLVIHNSIEQDADLVLMIYREDYYSQLKKNANISELIIAKQRNGPTDSIKLIFDPKIVSFSNIVFCP